MHLRLIFDVIYDPHDVPETVLRGFLSSIPALAVAEGFLTGSTEATVDEWGYEIVRLE